MNKLKYAHTNKTCNFERKFFSIIQLVKTKETGCNQVDEDMREQKFLNMFGSIQANIAILVDNLAILIESN